MPKPRKGQEEVEFEQDATEVPTTNTTTTDTQSENEVEFLNSMEQDKEENYTPEVDAEGERIKEVFAELVKHSSKVTYEKVGVTSYDGETHVSLKLETKAFDALRLILLTLRTEYQLSLV